MTESETVLTLAPFQMWDELGRPITVTAEGVVTLPKGEWGRITTDGRVTDSQGELRARLDNGRVIDAQGEAFAMLADDGSAVVEGIEFQFDENGKLVLGSGTITLIPADSPARRAAMLVVLIALLRPSAMDIDIAPDMRPDNE